MIRNLLALLAVAAIGTASLFVTPNAQAQAKLFDPSTSATATGSAGAATCNSESCTVTTESLSTAAQASYTWTYTNNLITTGSMLLVNVDKGTATTGGLVPAFITPSAGSAVIIFQNPGSAAVNGTVKIRVTVLAK